ncbi:MAG: flagellar basal body P-ring formation chaperone FlgA [Deltaproteobacteria bacterium]
MFRVKIYILLVVLTICAAAIIGPVPALCKLSHEEMLMQKIREHIDRNMLHSPENVRLEFLSRMPATDHPAGKITFGIESKPSEEYIGDTSFNVRTFKNGIFLKEETVRVRIEVLREFVMSQKSIDRNNVLSTDDVTVQKKWVKHIPLNAVSSLDDAIGKMIVVSIRPNARITRSMLKEVLPVKRGKLVQVIVDNGVMKIMMSGMAEEDGAEDAVVKVRNLNSNKIIYARVVGQSKVQVDF